MRTTAAVPAGPLRRTVTALGSLLLLAGLIAGLPAALVLLAGDPLPAAVPTMDEVWATLTSPDDGTLFLDVLAVVGWLAWASFTGSVLLEVAARLGRRRAPSIPGLRSQQRFAAVLVAAVAAVATSPTMTSASAALVDAPVDAAPVVATATAGVTEPVARGFGAAGGAEQSVQRGLGAAEQPTLHLVGRGEGILDLQERYGVPWQQIAEANYGVEQPDGRKLERGQTRIYPGWQMRIPAAAHTPTSAPEVGFGARGDLSQPAPTGADRPAGGGDAAPEPAAPGSPAASGEADLRYEVAQGDWMWHIADRYLGDPERYQDIAALNPHYADQHGNFPDHIEPGWTLQLPADAVDGGAAPHATGTAAPADAAPEVDQPEAEPPEAEPPGAQQPGAEHPGAEHPGAEQPEPGHPEAEADRPAPEQPAPPAPESQAPQPPAPESPAPPAREPQAPSPGSGGAVPPAQAGAPPVAAPAPGGPGQPGHAPPLVPETSPAPAAPPAVGFGAAPAAEPDGFTASAEQHLERLAPAALASAGLLTALVFGAAAHQLRRRRQEHQAGYRFTSAPAQRLEKTLRAAQQPLDAARLEAALRHVAAGLVARPGPPPDLAGAMVDAGAVHLLLAAPCPDPPAPWQDRGDRWTLPAGASLPPADPSVRLALPPTLATVGSQAGIHLLLDLARLGFLALHGDPAGARDLLRYLAAELVCHTWSDGAEVVVTGFDPRETELLLAIGAERLRPVPSVADAVGLLRQRVAAVRAAADHTAGSLVRGATGGPPAQILLVATPTPADLAALAGMAPELAGSGCAVVAATTDANPPRHGAWRVTVTPDGVVHVRLPFLRASLTAATLAVEELVPLAETALAARTAPLRPVPAAPEAEPWAAAADAAGRARPAPAPAADPSDSTAALPTGPLPPAYPGRTSGDPGLDSDLYAWQQGGTGRPRIGVLGPVIVDAAGPPPQAHRRLHAELVVYLAQCGSRGAAAGSLDAALWPDVPVGEAARQAMLARVGRWLGTDRDGTPWLTGAEVCRLAEGYLFDWHLFRRLRARSAHRGPDGAEDLRAALRLVRGVPLDGADRPRAPGTRNPYPWLAESAMHPDHMVATIVETAHDLAERCLAAGDPEGARWAVRQAWLADPGRSYDQPWRDLLRAEQADGQTGRLRSVLAELMRVREVGTPEDLAPETYELISCWPRHVLAPAG